MKKEETKNEIKTIDAKGKTLGRLASEVAFILMGKDKVTYKRNTFSGTPVKVTNASFIKITNKKLEEMYHPQYSGYPGGLKILTGKYTKEKKGMSELVKLAVYKMLPGNKLRKTMMKNLQVEE
jgi:large subunit ribosomal protein L13